MRRVRAFNHLAFECANNVI